MVVGLPPARPVLHHLKLCVLRLLTPLQVAVFIDSSYTVVLFRPCDEWQAISVAARSDLSERSYHPKQRVGFHGG